MPGKSGLFSQLGWKKEVTWGTAVTVDNFLPLVSEDLVDNVEQLYSEGIITGRRHKTADQIEQGGTKIEGSTNLELHTHGLSVLLEILLGTRNKTGAGPYTHAVTPGELSSATLQVGRPNNAGTVDAFTFAGCKVSSWELACSAGEVARLGVDWSCRSVTTATALATATMPSVMSRFRWSQAVVTLNSVNTYTVTEFTINGDNKLETDLYGMGSNLIAEQNQIDHREYKAEVTLRYPGTATRLKGSVVPLLIVFTAGAHTLTLDMDINVDEDPATVGGRGMVEQKISGTLVGTTAADSGAITATLVNTENN
jgi:hypothetical protein